MTHSKIPKYTKSRPFGMPTTPFNPRTGQYLPLGNNPDILKVLVKRKVEASDHTYVCTVLDSKASATGERIKARRLVYDPADELDLDDIIEDTVTFAFRVDGKWWLQVGEESTIPTVDYIVDLFDRPDSPNMGDLWNNTSIHRITNQQSWLWGILGNQAYLAKLSSHNFNINFDYTVDHSVMSVVYSNFIDDPGFSYSYTLFRILVGYDTKSDTGVYMQARVQLREEYEGGGVYVNYVKYNLTIVQGLGMELADIDVKHRLQGFSSIKYFGNLSISVNEHIFSYSCPVFSGNVNLLGVIPTEFAVWGGVGVGDGIMDNFKTWVSTIPEPPDESGHGKFINGQYVYSDKYHAGEEYNPSA